MSEQASVPASLERKNFQVRVDLASHMYELSGTAHFDPTKTLKHINKQSLARKKAQGAPRKGANSFAECSLLFVARAAACAAVFFSAEFLPTFCVVYLDGVPPSARASVHSSVTMQRMPEVKRVGRERERER